MKNILIDVDIIRLPEPPNFDVTFIAIWEYDNNLFCESLRKVNGIFYRFGEAEHPIFDPWTELDMPIDQLYDRCNSLQYFMKAPTVGTRLKLREIDNGKEIIPSEEVTFLGCDRVDDTMIQIKNNQHVRSECVVTHIEKILWNA